MDQNSQNFLHLNIPPLNIIPNLEPQALQEPYDNNSMFYGHPEYYHQRASNLGAGMSTAPNIYLPYAAFHAPQSHLISPGSHGSVVGVASTEHVRNAHFVGHSFKQKSAEVIPDNTLETVPFSFPHFGTYPQPPDQRSMRNRGVSATMDPLLSYGHNNFIQGNYAAHPFPLPGSIWYDQHCNSNRSDGSFSSLWSPAPSVPYIHGNVVTGSIHSGTDFFPSYQETSSSRNSVPYVYPRHNYFSHHLAPPPPTVYPHMASTSYTVPETMHDASYRHVGMVPSTGFRINQQHTQADFVSTATLRHNALPHFRAIPTDEVAVLGEGDFYDAVNYVDHHQDMRLDIEDMSYEELLALSDQIGTVKTGLSEEEVTDLLKRKTSILTRINQEEAPSTYTETEYCTICQENFENQDKIATLDCRHEYHAECLKKWLVIKNICPICKSEALVMD